MEEYNQYVTAVNKIFDYLAKMKAGWDSIDNFNYIESIEEYRNSVIKYANVFKEQKSPPKTQDVEALGDD
jgi:hypothetical protein